MSRPRVSFVVPCYNYAHYLRECVESILAQSFGDLEVLIMDDCSPDNTPEVARSIADPRVRYVRNEPNLGHLENYKKGLSLARGDFLYLISADDKLRKTHLLERYVPVMDAHPSVGYAFCPAVQLRESEEVESFVYGSFGDTDRILSGREFVVKLLDLNYVATPAALVRRRCYADFGTFPPDLPHSGDWYLWCLFALHSDVAYFAEPMVNYRVHGASMSKDYNVRMPLQKLEQEFQVRWRIRAEAERLGDLVVAEAALTCVTAEYARRLLLRRSSRATLGISDEELVASVTKNARGAREAARILGAIYSRVADEVYETGDSRAARRDYSRALKYDPLRVRTIVKRVLVALGGPGRRFRELIGAARQRVSGNRGRP